MKFVLFSLLACVFTLSACTDRDPVSSKQPDADTEVAAKRTSSSITLSAPVAGLAESRQPPPKDDGMEDGDGDGMEDGAEDGMEDGDDDGMEDDGGTDDSSGSES